MRSTYVLLLLALPAIGVVNAYIFGNELKRFANEVKTIASTSDIERFKAVVARQMYAALAQIAILGSPMIIFFVGIKKSVLGPSDVLLIIIPSAIILVVAHGFKKTETQVKNIPAADDELRRQRDTIVATWLTKPFPDW